jgi:hypothetical protein
VRLAWGDRNPLGRALASLEQRLDRSASSANRQQIFNLDFIAD